LPIKLAGLLDYGDPISFRPLLDSHKRAAANQNKLGQVCGKVNFWDRVAETHFS